MTLPPVRRVASYAGSVSTALLLLFGAAPLLTLTPAHAATTRTIELTANGPKPATLTAAVGDAIVFRNTDQTFVHQVDEASTNWAFDCPPLAPDQTCPAGRLTKAGQYLYEGVNLDSFKGKVVVPAAPSPAPSPARSAAPSTTSSPAAGPSAAASPGAASPAASTSPTGGTGGSGTAGTPPLTGGFGSGGFPSTAPSAGGPAPDLAPALPGEQPASADPASSGPAVAISPGRLPEPTTARRYGLPAALAAVAAVGVGSLLLRLLLAHPAARARRLDGSVPAVIVD